MVYNLVISHSWAYSDAYKKLCNLLDEYKYFTYYNYSVPKDDPVHTNGTDKELANAIYNKMRSCNIILIMAGVYSTYSKWINKEIKIANSFINSKPILGIKPRGQTNVSTIVQENAIDIVGWNSSSIVDAIRKYSV